MPVGLDGVERIEYRHPVSAQYIQAPAGGFAGPKKRSITIAGHQTSISLEPIFWAALEAAARRRGLPLSALVAQVDAHRVSQPRPINLASALRSWALIESENSSQ